SVGLRAVLGFRGRGAVVGFGGCGGILGLRFGDRAVGDRAFDRAADPGDLTGDEVCEFGAFTDQLDLVEVTGDVQRSLFVATVGSDRSVDVAFVFTVVGEVDAISKVDIEQVETEKGRAVDAVVVLIPAEIDVVDVE